MDTYKEPYKERRKKVVWDLYSILEKKRRLRENKKISFIKL